MVLSSNPPVAADGRIRYTSLTCGSNLGVRASYLTSKEYQSERAEKRLAAIEDRLNSTEANNAAQWSGMEQLLLALYRQPEARIESDGRYSVERDDPTTSVAGPDRTHEQNNLR
jgi:hypothetical protein